MMHVARPIFFLFKNYKTAFAAYRSCTTILSILKQQVLIISSNYFDTYPKSPSLPITPGMP